MFEIKAIIFDYGNVLCEPQPQEDVDAMAREAGVPADRFAEIYWRDRMVYDCAGFDASEYWSRVAGKQLDAPQVEKLVALDNKSWTHPRKTTLAWVDVLRQKG